MQQPGDPRGREPHARGSEWQIRDGSSEERFRLLVKSVKDYAIFMLDPGGCISSWNEGAARIKGWNESEILGEHFSIFYTPEDRARNHPANELRLAIRDGTYQEEGWRVRKDGSRFWASVVITALFDEEGELRGFAKVTRDMTERMEHERALAEKAAALERANAELRVQRAELEERNAEQETFIYTVSHDLRQPLLAIQGMGDLLVHAVRAGNADEAAFLMGRVSANIERMQVLLGDLLKLSRAGRRLEEAERVDLGQVVASVLADLEPRVNGLGLHLEMPVAWPAVTFGRSDAYQVLLNLVGNAVKFAGASEPPRVRLSWSAEGETITLQVEDNGPGIAPQYREKVFGLFQRASAKAEGSGVGLAIVRRIVERYGGKVWIEDSSLGGAAFLATIPAA